MCRDSERIRVIFGAVLVNCSAFLVRFAQQLPILSEDECEAARVECDISVMSLGRMIVAG